MFMNANLSVPLLAFAVLMAGCNVSDDDLPDLSDGADGATGDSDTDDSGESDLAGGDNLGPLDGYEVLSAENENEVISWAGAPDATSTALALTGSLQSGHETSSDTYELTLAPGTYVIEAPVDRGYGLIIEPERAIEDGEEGYRFYYPDHLTLRPGFSEAVASASSTFSIVAPADETVVVRVTFQHWAHYSDPTNWAHFLDDIAKLNSENNPHGFANIAAASPLVAWGYSASPLPDTGPDGYLTLNQSLVTNDLSDIDYEYTMKLDGESFQDVHPVTGRWYVAEDTQDGLQPYSVTALLAANGSVFTRLEESFSVVVDDEFNISRVLSDANTHPTFFYPSPISISDNTVSGFPFFPIVGEYSTDTLTLEHGESNTYEADYLGDLCCVATPIQEE